MADWRQAYCKPPVCFQARIFIMSKIESSIARMRHLQAIPVHYDMGDRYGNDADGNGRIDSLFAKYNYLEVRN